VAGPIPPGQWEVVVGKAKVRELPARYAVQVILRTAPTLAPQTERMPYVSPPALAPGPRWYAGDFHVHSRESGDAGPTIDEVLDFAGSRGLDFVLLSEHNTTSQLSLYGAAQAGHPNVLLLPGAEFTTYAGIVHVVTSYVWLQRGDPEAPTATSTPEPSPTVTQTPNPCAGDCDANGRVGINELITGVNISLGTTDLGQCRAFDRDGSVGVDIAELVAGVNASLTGCA
jgi:hypothetical protein